MITLIALRVREQLPTSLCVSVQQNVNTCECLLNHVYGHCVDGPTKRIISKYVAVYLSGGGGVQASTEALRAEEERLEGKAGFILMTLDGMRMQIDCSDKNLPACSALGLNPGFCDEIDSLCILPA